MLMLCTCQMWRNQKEMLVRKSVLPIYILSEGKNAMEVKGDWSQVPNILQMTFISFFFHF